MKLIETFRSSSIRVKLISLFILTSTLIFLVNLYVYINLNAIINHVDEIYAGNVVLTEMEETLEGVQSAMGEYLKTKNTDALESYYKNVQDFSNQTSVLNERITNNEEKIMEKTIRNLADSYLTMTNETVQAKRGRNIEKYVSGYENAGRMFRYINTYIYSLNNEQFKDSSVNYNALLASLRMSEYFSLSILILIALFNAFLVLLVTRSITNPLMELSKRADSVAKGELDVELIPVQSNDEIGVLTGAFNKMVISLREYIDQIRIRMELENAMKERELMMTTHLKDAQLKYLQAQINPHFLFNTLNAGAQLAMMEGADRTNKYIQNMADFFRYNVKKNNEQVTIAQEIELVDSYIYILNVRFSGDIHFEKELDEELLDLNVPSMIIQPVVENSVNYGIRNIDREGHIKLSLYKDGESACICVEDNGVGISREMIEKIMTRGISTSDVSADSNGVGLSNVIGRLKLFFDRDDIFTIESEGEDLGTKVTMRIPLDGPQKA
ncbi:MAG: DNA phosphorothioation-dependent restriction protein DptG [Lachnospiraceae bacterium]|nr:DNA phosphorothioation-dependent restriction protein DptG [Lachnospiraceae bacterium]